jgi:predicted RecA/RadA family phage recombinase
MSRTFIQRGDTVTIAAAAPIKSGDFVILGSLAGVAQIDAAAGGQVELMLCGVHELAKAGVALNAGARGYWHVANKQLVAAAGSGIAPIGVITETAGSSAAVARVRLDGVGVTVA